jgi:pyrroloquinoline quinone biosynthesis protein D
MRRPRIARKARLRWDKIESRYFLLFPERGLELNDSAAAILKLCDGSNTEDAIAEAVAREAGNVDLDAVRRDVVTFIDDMKKRGLVNV